MSREFEKKVSQLARKVEFDNSATAKTSLSGNTDTRSLQLSFCHSLTLSLSHSLILSFSHPLILSFCHSLTLSHSLSLTLSLSLFHFLATSKNPPHSAYYTSVALEIWLATALTNLSEVIPKFKEFFSVWFSTNFWNFCALLNSKKTG